MGLYDGENNLRDWLFMRANKVLNRAFLATMEDTCY